jgi:G:T-mismatch repair DNA endonuclease (very short patch repair protein)
MRIIKTHDNKRLIPISEFEVCKIDDLTRKEIIKQFPTRADGAYYLDKFKNHLLKNHKLSLVDYLKMHLDEYPKCLETGEDVNFTIKGSGLVFSNFKLGRGINKQTNEKFKRHCEKMSQDRMGVGNPMFGKIPWNKNNEEFANKMRSLRLGEKTSTETRKKQSESALKRKIHGHTGKKHSIETINKLREITSKRFSDGVFTRETSIHIKVRNFLNTLCLKQDFIEEFHIKYFSLDFAFPDIKLAIECQGTYFHIDPRFYPNGPQSKIQKRNFGRDVSKKKYLDKNGWALLELWETEINNDEFKEILICKLQELNLLKV